MMEMMIMTSTNKMSSQFLFELIKKSVDLSEFLETEIGCKLKWYEPNVSAGTVCPIHKDTKPSFRIKKMENGVWILHCLGCGVKGTIIDFCMEYYDLNFSDAILFLCKKYGFKESKDAVMTCLKDVKKKSNMQKKMEYTHIVTSNQCRMLLRKNYAEHSKWVGEMYRKMNDALENENVNVIEQIGFEASRKIQQKG